MFAGGVLRSYTDSATPRSERISIVRWLSRLALGNVDVVGRALTSRQSTPNCDNNIEAVNPAGPPPTTSTSTTATSTTATSTTATSTTATSTTATSTTATSTTATSTTATSTTATSTTATST